MTEFDTIIKGGMIVDGTRVPRSHADIGIKSGKIAPIGRLKPSDAARVIDACGLIVAPGFIDLHLPAGEWRRVQKAEGYRWIMVNGEPIFEDGKYTGATLGKLLRHGQAV